MYGRGYGEAQLKLDAPTGPDTEAGVQAGGRGSVTAQRLRSFTITVERGI